MSGETGEVAVSVVELSLLDPPSVVLGVFVSVAESVVASVAASVVASVVAVSEASAVAEVLASEVVASGEGA